MLRPGSSNAFKLTTGLAQRVVLTGFLVLSLSLVLAACGGGDEPPPVEATSTPVEAAPSSDATETPPTAVPTESPDTGPDDSMGAEPTETPPTAVPTESPDTGSEDSMGAEPTETPPTAVPTESPDTGSDDSTGAEPAEETPATGGVLRVGSVGYPGGQFSPFFPRSWAEGMALSAVYDRFVWTRVSDIVYALAESVTPNNDATEWTIVLRDAKFHDGSPVTSQDAAYSLAGFSNPQLAPTWSRYFTNVDAPNIRIVDEKTLVVPLHSPQGDFVERTLIHALVAPDGSVGGPDAIGSGPFKLKEFDDGKSVSMTRFDDHYGGAPYLDGLEIIYIVDPSARLNALKGGEIEVAAQISPAAARAEADNPNVVLLANDVANAITHSFLANTRIAPYDNPDVVRALRLAVDRQDLVDKVLLGYGQVGNDLIGKGHPGYNDSIPQIERDVEEARRLFASAGITELTLMTSEFTAGATAAAELMVQYVADAGVTLKLEVVPPDQWYADFQRLLTRPLQSAWGTNFPPTTFAAMTTGSQAGLNITGIGGEVYDSMLRELIEEVDPDRRRELALELQEYLHANDGRIVWGFQDELSAAIPGVTGVVYNSSIPLFHLARWER